VRAEMAPAGALVIVTLLVVQSNSRCPEGATAARTRATIALPKATILLGLGSMLAAMSAQSRDLGQWRDNDPAIRRWFQQLIQPDTLGTANPASCCGEGDGYYADEVHVEGDLVVAVITDDRDDRPSVVFTSLAGLVLLSLQERSSIRVYNEAIQPATL
jgi:hypothetical protein